MTTKFTAEKVIEELRRRQGQQGLRPLARSLGVDPMEINRAYSGQREPSPTLCSALGFAKVVERNVYYTTGGIHGKKVQNKSRK